MSPIPLGIWATAGASGAAGAYELIETAYGTGSSGTITFSSIPSTYKHLQIRYVARSGATQLDVTCNGAGTGNYVAHFLRGNGTAVSSGQLSTTASAGARLGFGLASLDVANVHNAGVIDFLDYANTNKYKTMRALYGGHYVYAGNYTNIYEWSGLFMQTAAISSITLSATDIITATSRFSLYGIRG